MFVFIILMLSLVKVEIDAVCFDCQKILEEADLFCNFSDFYIECVPILD